MNPREPQDPHEPPRQGLPDYIVTRPHTAQPPKRSRFGFLLRIGVFAFIAVVCMIFVPPLIMTVSGAYFIAAAMGTFAAAAIANAIAVRIYERGRLVDIGLGWTDASRWNLGIGVAGGIGSAIIVVILPILLRKAEFAPSPAEPGRWRIVLFVTAILLFGAIGEELLFRGYAFQVLVREIGPFATILPFAILFALAHLNNPNTTMLGIVNTFLWGVLLGYSFLRSGDLWLPIGLHFGWNWMLPVLGANLSGFTMAITGYTLHWMARPLWSGAQYGPEGSVLTTMVVPALFWFLHRAPIRQQEAFLLRPHDQELQS
ncbi:MAG TPA: type II CAAX endopeptidase family protein [Bryobacteraceae bacterium]|nr:type II CAAX endopeptidase family protein [Bryobacteraceae bacterium]